MPDSQPDSAELARRLAARDASLWPEGNVSATRLGWLDVVAEERAAAADLTAWADGIRARYRLAVLFGMGGSSLAPETFRALFGGPLRVLDSTEPATVASALEAAVPDGIALVASKSGGTVEPNSMLAAWRDRVPDPERVVAITDPGTELDTRATEAHFARVFRNRPDIGGRYSALSDFGLVPAALLGVDLAALLDFDDTDLEPGVRLGVYLAAEQAAGRDKLTVQFSSPLLARFGLWIEQLVAESTGKNGTGIIPIAGEAVGAPEVYDDDRTFVFVSLPGASDPAIDALEAAGFPILRQELASPSAVGELMFRWEVAIAIVGSQLGIDPFNEPDVAVAKAATQKLLVDWPGVPPAATTAEVRGWLDANVHRRDYVAIQAFLPEDDLIANALAELQRVIRNRHRVAVSRGFGPRFLHSTGQLHKGGPNTVVALQLVAGPSAGADQPDVEIPGEPFTFGRLIAAQALGDFDTLESRGRRVMRVDLGDDPAVAIALLAAALSR
ncbi:MAG: transaldolase / glucose-6-phosphate isomerase [Actinomycetia bacterium]|nr:transaldolase / glucose-6-phosphate isomerase [Actinomycetes bacterium]